MLYFDKLDEKRKRIVGGPVFKTYPSSSLLPHRYLFRYLTFPNRALFWQQQSSLRWVKRWYLLKRAPFLQKFLKMQALLPKIFNGSNISQFQALSWSERVKLWRVRRKIDLRLWQWGGLDSSSSSLGFFFSNRARSFVPSLRTEILKQTLLTFVFLTRFEKWLIGKHTLFPCTKSSYWVFWIWAQFCILTPFNE